MNVYRVWYWDPCNGMNGQSKDCGLFSTRERAEEYIEPRAKGWDKDAYRIQEIAVSE